MMCMRYPPNFSERVDFSRVNEDYVRNWIANEIGRIQGQEDDILAGYVAELLYAGAEKDGEAKAPVDPRRLQLRLMAFLYDNAAQFVESLWTMLLAAQSSPDGLPPEAKAKAAPEPRQTQTERSLDLKRELVDDTAGHRRAEERLHARRRTSSRSRSRSWSRSSSESQSGSASPSGSRSRSPSPSKQSETAPDSAAKREHHHEHHHEHHRERHHSKRSGSRSSSRHRRHHHHHRSPTVKLPPDELGDNSNLFCSSFSCLSLVHPVVYCIVTACIVRYRIR